MNQKLLSYKIQLSHYYATQRIKGALELIVNCIPWRQKISWIRNWDFMNHKWRLSFSWYLRFGFRCIWLFQVWKRVFIGKVCENCTSSATEALSSMQQTLQEDKSENRKTICGVNRVSISICTDIPVLKTTLQASLWSTLKSKTS